jgi:hypothetical protein
MTISPRRASPGVSLDQATKTVFNTMRQVRPALSDQSFFLDKPSAPMKRFFSPLFVAWSIILRSPRA